MRNKRGVSPIIATILLVAITVVLAAVLYILISGLTRGPGNTPIGTAYGMAGPNQEKGNGASTPGCAGTGINGHVCYTVAIASAGGGITWSSVAFVIHDSNGNPVSVLSGFSIGIVNTTGVVVGTCILGTACAITAGPATISTAETVVVDTGSTTANFLGDSLVANGQGSYGSSTSVNFG